MDDSPKSSGLRFALSFRKLNQVPKYEEKAEKVITSTPLPKSLKLLSNGFTVHPERAASLTPIQSAPSTTQELPPSQPPTTQHHFPPHIASSSQAPSTQHHQPPNTASASHAPTSIEKHLIIGDSMVNGLRVPGSICIFKGGIRPGELLQLLSSSSALLPPENYEQIRSVTVVVGTNALNVFRPGQGMPFLNVVTDYEKLIHDLQSLFPNARLGLYNVLPRAHTCMETVYRIKDFNNIFQSHVASRLKNVSWLNHFHEFLDYRGFIREDLYGRLGVHLKGKGKGLMARYIRSFQQSFN